MIKLTLKDLPPSGYIPVHGVVEEGEDAEQGRGVGGLIVVANRLQDREHDMKTKKMNGIRERLKKKKRTRREREREKGGENEK